MGGTMKMNKPDQCPECGSTNLTEDESTPNGWYCLCCGFGLELEDSK